MTRYFKLRPSIKTTQDFSIDLPMIAQYLLHPGFIFAVDNINGSSLHTSTGWVVAGTDVHEISPAEAQSNSIIVYQDQNGNDVEVDCLNLSDRMDFLNYNGTQLSSLVFDVNNIKTMQYGPLQEKTVNFYTDYLKKEVTHRYAMVPLSTVDSNLLNIVDSSLPHLLVNGNFRAEHMQLRSHHSYTAISPFTADLLNVNRVPFEDLISLLGYTKEQLTNLTKIVKEKNYDFIFVGAGGTGMNTAVWLSEIVRLTGIKNIFKTVTVHEEESAEFTNLLRFPLSTALNYNAGTHKLHIIKPYINMLSPQVSITATYLPNTRNEFHNRVFKDLYGTNGFRPDTNPVFYGAPDLVSRSKLSPLGRFVCATHANSTCSIWLNPSQDLDIQVESYGMIQLAPFFMNQLRMTIGLLELLASDQNLDEQDKHILEYEFQGNSQIDYSKNKPYSFDIVQDVRAYQEEGEEDA